jgi:hypothetical protein
MSSQVQITDGQWHHVGLVWDAWTGKTRKLYVDGIEEASSILTECPVRSKSPLRIGTAQDQDNTGLWSGLIDDVRIYKVALNAEEVAALAQ